MLILILIVFMLSVNEAMIELGYKSLDYCNNNQVFKAQITVSDECPLGSCHTKMEIFPLFC